MEQVKRLGLMRHAKSVWDDLTVRDFDRGLNGRGRKGAALMGAHLASRREGWDLALASSAVRVRQTLDASGLSLPVRFEDSAYLADAATLLGLLQSCEDTAEAVLLIGHNPGLPELALQLVAPENEDALFDLAMRKFPTAALAVMELDIAHWSALTPGCGKLVHFMRPRDLDPELGPSGNL